MARSMRGRSRTAARRSLLLDTLADAALPRYPWHVTRDPAAVWAVPNMLTPRQAAVLGVADLDTYLKALREEIRRGNAVALFANELGGQKRRAVVVLLRSTFPGAFPAAYAALAAGEAGGFEDALPDLLEAILQVMTEWGCDYLTAFPLVRRGWPRFLDRVGVRYEAPGILILRSEIKRWLAWHGRRK